MFKKDEIQKKNKYPKHYLPPVACIYAPGEKHLWTIRESSTAEEVYWMISLLKRTAVTVVFENQNQRVKEERHTLPQSLEKFQEFFPLLFSVA